VSWSGVYSKEIKLLAGIRQGGVLSPYFFAIYVDNLIEAVIQSDLGCHIGGQVMSIFMYADDLILLSGSIRDMQSMINICENEISKLDMKINVKKSCCIRIGRYHDRYVTNILYNGDILSWCQQTKYLGLTFFASNRLTIDLKNCTSKFYRAFNSIYSKSYKSNENVIVSLVKSFCLPTLLYGLEAVDLTKTDIRKLETPIIRAFAKIFKSYDSSMIQWCMYYFNFMTAENEIIFRKLKFLHKLQKLNINLCIDALTDNIKKDIADIENLNNIDHNDSFVLIKAKLNTLPLI
jgi:hypothetical protein